MWLTKVIMVPIVQLHSCSPIAGCLHACRQVLQLLHRVHLGMLHTFVCAAMILLLGTPLFVAAMFLLLGHRV